MAKWKDIRKTAVCKSCGASLADKPTESKFCSLKCCGIDKVGKAREDCRKYKTCKACGKTGFGVSFCGYGRDVCADCYKPTEKPKKRFQCIRCGEVGFGVKFMPPSSKGRCCKCWGDDKERNRLKAAAMLLRPCKVCGKAIGTNDKRQVVCSKECGHKGRTQEKVELSCCNCGKKVERYKSRLEFRSVFACSLECQRQYALIENHSTAGKTDWIKKSTEAKKRWKVIDSRKRRLCNPWMRKIRKKLDKCKELKVDTNSWKYRVALRLNAAVGRKRRKQVEAKASRTVEQALRKIREKRKLFELSDWEKKIGWKLSSHKARRARKENAQKHGQVEGVSSRCQDKGKWVQVCFEWVAD